MTQSYGESAEPWRQRWLNGQTGWDHGQEHAVLNRLLQHAMREGPLQPSASIFSAGCGRAHNEAWLARQGFKVDASDIVEEAIAGARALYEHQKGLRLFVADAFAPNDGSKIYDAVFDRAMLCAVNPMHRAAYVQRMQEKLPIGGIFMSILFRKVRSPEGPPFAVDEAEALRLLEDDFDLCHASSCPPPEHTHNVLEEWLCVWRKRAKDT